MKANRAALLKLQFGFVNFLAPSYRQKKYTLNVDEIDTRYFYFYISTLLQNLNLNLNLSNVGGGFLFSSPLSFRLIADNLKQLLQNVRLNFIHSTLSS
jgi:hypothetical protein